MDISVMAKAVEGTAKVAERLTTAEVMVKAVEVEAMEAQRLEVVADSGEVVARIAAATLAEMAEARHRRHAKIEPAVAQVKQACMRPLMMLLQMVVARMAMASTGQS
jgi:hypothetical protein